MEKKEEEIRFYERGQPGPQLGNTISQWLGSICDILKGHIQVTMQHIQVTTQQLRLALWFKRTEWSVATQRGKKIWGNMEA